MDAFTSATLFRIETKRKKKLNLLYFHALTSSDNSIRLFPKLFFALFPKYNNKKGGKNRKKFRRAKNERKTFWTLGRKTRFLCPMKFWLKRYRKERTKSCGHAFYTYLYVFPHKCRQSSLIRKRTEIKLILVFWKLFYSASANSAPNNVTHHRRKRHRTSESETFAIWLRLCLCSRFGP